MSTVYTTIHTVLYTAMLALLTSPLRSAGVVPPTDDETEAAAASALIWRVESLAVEHKCHPQLYDAVQVGERCG